MDKEKLKDSWLLKLNSNYKEQKENINPRDLNFFNIEIMLDLARITQKNSYKCEECKKNKDILMELSGSISKNIDTIDGRKQITKKLDKIIKHLRQKHKMYIRRYVSSLYTIIGLVGGLIIGVVLGYIFSKFLFFILVLGAVGLFLGSFTGSLKEKKLLKKEQIYGKF